MLALNGRVHHRTCPNPSSYTSGGNVSRRICPVEGKQYMTPTHNNCDYLDASMHYWAIPVLLGLGFGSLPSSFSSYQNQLGREQKEGSAETTKAPIFLFPLQLPLSLPSLRYRLLVWSWWELVDETSCFDLLPYSSSTCVRHSRDGLLSIQEVTPNKCFRGCFHIRFGSRDMYYFVLGVDETNHSQLRVAMTMATMTAMVMAHESTMVVHIVWMTSYSIVMLY